MKLTVWFGFGRLGVKSKAAVGPAFSADTETVWLVVEVSPSESVTRRPTVLVPGVEYELLTCWPLASS